VPPQIEGDVSSLTADWPEAGAFETPCRYRVCRCTKWGGEDWLEDLSLRILSPGEREIWSALPGREKRHRDWLLGRLAAKHAVRGLLAVGAAPPSAKSPFGPADVEIRSDPFNRPYLDNAAELRPEGDILISIAHWRAGAAAVAADGRGLRGAGIDVESLDRGSDRLETITLTEPERALLPPGSPADSAEERNAWLMRFWCAKESVAKALGRGLMGSPFNLVVQGFDAASGRVSLGISGGVAREFADRADKTFTAHTGCDRTVAFAVAFV
jgi:4'-phosphopantetheinyl transferase EntD